MEKIVIKSEINRKELYKLLFYTRTWGVIGFFFFGAILTLAIFLCANANFSGSFLFTSPVFQLLCIFLFVVFLGPYYSANKIIKRQNNATYSFTPDTISYTSLSVTGAESSWKSVSRAILYGNTLALVVNKNKRKLLFVISKNSLTNEQYATIKEILNTRKLKLQESINFDYDVLKSWPLFLRFVLAITLIGAIFLGLKSYDKYVVNAFSQQPFTTNAGTPYIDTLITAENIMRKCDSIKPISETLNKATRIPNGINPYSIECIYIDPKGIVWIGTFGRGICRFDGDKFTYYSRIRNKNDTGINCIEEDNHGNLWIGTADGLVCFTGNNFITYSKISGSFGEFHNVDCIHKDRKGNLWFGAGHGICCYSGRNVINYRFNQGLCSNLIASIAEDTFGNLWFGSNPGLVVPNSEISPSKHPETQYGGVSCFNGKTFKNFTTAQGLASNSVLKIQVSKNNRIWFQGFGLCSYDGKEITCYDNSNDFYTYHLIAFYIDNRGTMWVTSQAKTYFSNEDESRLNEFPQLNSFQVNCINQDMHNNLWFGTASGMLIKYDGSSITKYQVY